jgi:hypothetical protein
VGTWGTGIFDDDLASDVRAAYLEALTAGASAEEAAQQAQSKFAHALQDEDESLVFWFSIASIQAQYGAITNTVRQRTLELIELNRDSARWKDASVEDQQARQRVLDELKTKLQNAS